MKSFKELLEESKKMGSVKTLTPKFVKFEQEGDSVVGRLNDVEEVGDVEEGTVRNQYHMDTDDGPVKFSMGGNADKEVGELMTPGKVYYIEFQGQQQTRSGRKVNQFSVVEVPETVLKQEKGQEGQ